ncbi:MAG: 3-dehydroquinate synthase [Bacteroidales bacterium]|nr:3-dehydroquinate synthase [Bacteroidales bacterium]
MNTKYIIHSSNRAFSSLDKVLSGKAYNDARYFILCDENTYNHCLPILISHTSRLQESEFLEVPVGEEAKTIDVAMQLWKTLLDSNADRKSVIINLGGGCISDLGGFVASAYKRGIRYINIPTSLIGMVDASIGGKTAVNIDNIKNQIGYIHQPSAVVINPDFLNTLSEKDVVSGYFEIVKTLLLCDKSAFQSLLENSDVSDDIQAIKKMIPLCVDFKKSVVDVDPTELSIRRILNLGHTFGHAIESFFIDNGDAISHGLAVGYGLLCELYLSVKKLGLSDSILKEYCGLLRRFSAFPRLSLRDTEQILKFMRSDKKNADGNILCVLLQDIGEPVIDIALDELEVRDALLAVSKL